VRSAALRAGLRRKEEDFLFPFPAVETAGYYQSSPFGDCAAFGREEGAFALRTRHLRLSAMRTFGDMPGYYRPSLAGLIHGEVRWSEFPKIS